MKKENHVSSKKSLFIKEEQDAVVENNEKLLDMMRTARNVKHWNELRVKVARAFEGTPLESLMLFGHIDGILFPQVFK